MPEEFLNNKDNSKILLSNYEDSNSLDENITLRPFETIVYYLED